MVDITTHKIIDMIESREKEDVIKWLKSFPNLSIVSRDGSLTYQDAINRSHPNAIQVSDRFHILKNLTDYCCKYIKSVLKNNIEIPCKDEFNLVSLREKYRFNTKWEIICAVKDLNLQGYSNKNIQDILQLNFRTVKKYLEVESKDREKYDRKPQYIAVSEAKLQQKIDIKKDIKELLMKGKSYREIESILGIDRRTAKKYAETDDLTDARIGQRKYGKITPHINKIKELLSKDYSKRKIYESIKQDGYDGCESLLREYLLREIRNQKLFKKAIFTEIIQRQKLISLLYNPIEKVTGINEDHFKKILELYPILKHIFEAVSSFKEILKSNNVNLLDQWLNKIDALSIEELTSFTSGIRRDINAVKNAIITPINNGLAEGTINKLKVIKRIMYGRCNFELLRKKAISLQYI